MSKSLERGKIQTDKDVLKNVADFFYESISNFRRTVNDLSVSINNFLNSLIIIERQLGDQGFEFPENSSEVLYERLTTRKEIREKEQQKFVKELVQGPIAPSSTAPTPKVVETIQQVKSPPKPGVPPKRVVPLNPPKKAGPTSTAELVIKPVDNSNASTQRNEKLRGLREEMLETVRKLKKMVKDY